MLTKDRIAGLLIIPPLFSLGFAAVSWLRHGVDLPFQDDWGPFGRAEAGSFALESLLRAGGDTLSPVGRFLDALAQRVLDGHAVTYQLVSMIVVMGLLLFFQWRLLSRVLEDRLSVAICFLLTVFMLQPDTYWGRQNMAYHQAIALVCVLAALNLALSARWRDRWGVPAAFAISLIAGFSYISGAVAMLMTGATLALFGTFARSPDARPVRLCGWALLAGAAISLPAQLWVIFGLHGGQTHRQDAPWTFPWESDYWLFLLGQVARSLLLPKKYPVASLAVTAMLGIAMTAAAIWFVIRLWKGRLQDPRLLRLAIAYVALLASIVAYIGMVSAGRAGMGAEAVDSSVEVFAAGFRRFYFAWVTLIWPWVAACILVAMASRDWGRRDRAIAAGAVLAVAVVVCAAVSGSFSHGAYYARLGARMKDEVACLRQQLYAGKGILCPRLHPGDLSSAYAYARMIGASLVRQVPLKTVRLGEPGPDPVFRLSAAPSASPGSGLTIDTGPDGNLGACRHLQVALALPESHVDSYTGPAQLRFRRTGAAAPSIAYPEMAVGAEGAASEAYFHLDSNVGFEPGLELLASAASGGLAPIEVEVRCLLWRK